MTHLHKTLVRLLMSIAFSSGHLITGTIIKCKIHLDRYMDRWKVHGRIRTKCGQMGLAKIGHLGWKG